MLPLLLNILTSSNKISLDYTSLTQRINALPLHQASQALHIANTHSFFQINIIVLDMCCEIKLNLIVN